MGSFVNRAYRLLARFYYVRKIIRELEPDIIHIHLPISKYIRFAKPKNGTKIVYTQHFITRRLFENYPFEVKHIKWLINNYPFQFIALNEEMKVSLNEFFQKDNTIVLNNGIDFARYEIKISIKKKRQEIHLPENAFVIGHIGRLTEIKNQMFLLDVFREYQKYNNNSYLLLIGTGEDKDKIIQKAKKTSLFSKMIILENRCDVPELLKCIDIFVFPSKHEGLGIAVIEAQISGIPCIVSDKVPKATQISNLINYVSLNDIPKQWADYINVIYERNIIPQYYHKDDWDIHNICRKLEQIYIE